MSRLVVVSGGGTGIGRAIAGAFAGSGDEVLIIGRRADQLETTARELNKQVEAELVQFRPADLTDAQEGERIAAELAAAGRVVGVVVNNAGGFYGLEHPDTVAGIEAQWRANFEGNVLPAVLLTHALIPLLSRPGGRIVTVSSIAALRGPGTYGGAKAALHPWTAELAERLGPDGITANVIAPGFVEDTEFFGDRMTEAGYQARVRQTLVGKAGRPEQIAALAVHLASAAAAFTTGQIIQVNGGALLGRG